MQYLMVLLTAYKDGFCRKLVLEILVEQARDIKKSNSGLVQIKDIIYEPEKESLTLYYWG